jgi:hypothetical protein
MGANAPTGRDLRLLEAVVDLTRRRVAVAAAAAHERAYGRAPATADLVELRLAVLRLERDGLVRSDRELRLEPTPDGEVAVELLRARRTAERPTPHEPGCEATRSWGASHPGSSWGAASAWPG